PLVACDSGGIGAAMIALLLNLLVVLAPAGLPALPPAPAQGAPQQAAPPQSATSQAPPKAVPSPTPAPSPAPAPAPAASAPVDPQLDAKIAAAGSDVAKLLALAATCSSAGQDDAAKTVYGKVLAVDKDNEVAHKGLHHQLYDHKWFESFAELSKYKRD